MKIGLTAFLIIAVLALIASACFALTPQSPTPAEAAAYPHLLEKGDALLKDKKYTEAAALYEKATRLNPVEGYGWSNLAQAYYGEKEYRKAIPCFQKALELGFGYRFNSIYGIARCHAMLGEKAKALTKLEEALGAGYRFLDEMRKDEDLTSLRDDPKFVELAATADVTKMSRDEGWRYDLRLLYRELCRIHYPSKLEAPKRVRDAFVSKLNAAIPMLTDPQITVRLMELTRMFGDAHTVLRTPMLRGPEAVNVPLQLYLFEEGLFVTAVSPQHADLAGAQVVKIGGQPIENVIKALDRIISQDNPMWVKQVAPGMMINPLILNGLGLIPHADRITYLIRDAYGKEREVELAAEHGELNDNWALARERQHPPLYLKHPEPHWFEYLPDEKLLYCQYAAVQDQPGETVAQFFEKVFKALDENDVQRFVLDMRRNGGGNLFLNQPLIHGILRHQKIDKPGRFFVIIGRATFSAAVSGVSKLDANTNAIFVGEPIASPPNFVGESIPVRLPYSKMFGSISDLYWQNTFAMDYRTWVAPSLYTPPTFAMLKSGRDPAMEAILEFIKQNPSS